MLRCLSAAGVEFVLVGGAAATAHGSARLTQDIDVVYRRSSANIACLVATLADHAPYLRGAPPGLPFRWDTRTLERGLNFTLTTDLADLDLLGEIVGGTSSAQQAAPKTSRPSPNSRRFSRKCTGENDPERLIE